MNLLLLQNVETSESRGEMTLKYEYSLKERYKYLMEGGVVKSLKGVSSGHKLSCDD
jgi:hypothetical protein